MLFDKYVQMERNAMMIRVVYHDNSYDTIPFFILQLGIDCNKIKMFYRSSEKRWVTVGVDPVRKSREDYHAGPERRTVNSSAAQLV
jgi:hypothetical protein